MRLPPAVIVVETGPNVGQEYVLAPAPVSLGRETMNDLVFADPEVSRRHARIIPREGGYVLEDLGSTNGSYVNEQRLTAPRQLNAGDLVRLGENVRLRFSLSVANYPLAEVDKAAAPASSARQPAAGAPPPQAATAAIYESPAAYQASPSYIQTQVSPADVADYKPRVRRWLIGCGIVALLLVIVCSSTLFWLDANRPELLYGPLRSLWQLIGAGG